MQLAPTSFQPAPTTVPTPFAGVVAHVATGHWTAPHGAPTYVAGWWTAGVNLAPGGGWTSRHAALEGARVLSLQADGPVAVTTVRGHDDQPFVLYHAYRLATSEPTEGDAGWADRPTRWLTSDMVRAPQFRGWTMTGFELAGIADRGALLPAGTRD